CFNYQIKLIVPTIHFHGHHFGFHGRHHHLKAPVEDTAAGNTICLSPFGIPRPATLFDGPRSGYRGRQHRLMAPVRDTAAGNTVCRPPYTTPLRPPPGTKNPGAS